MEQESGDVDEELEAGGQPQPEPAQPTGGNNRLKYAGALITAAILGALIGAMCLPGGDEHEAPPVPGISDRALGEVSDFTADAELLWRVRLTNARPDGTLMAMPADVAVVGDRIFLLDTNNSRIVEIDEAGDVVGVLGAEVEDGPGLQMPMAITSHGGELYVANSGGADVVVLDLEGNVQREVTPDMPQASRPLRPVGIAVSREGDIFLSDPDNNRVLHLSAAGKLLSTLGSGERASGAEGFNTPGGLSMDRQGNLYVVDMLNYSVKKFSPSGELMLSVGQAGDTEATFSRPKAVAVDAGGRIFASDTLLRAIQTFDADGEYAGFVGREDPQDKESEPLFEAPHGVKVVGGTLYVMDRFAGLFAFRIGS